MTPSIFANKVLKTVKSNSPEILTALGVSGVVTTSYLTAKASFKSASRLAEEDPQMTFVERAKVVWKDYIPAGISGVLTITCIVGASKTNGRRTAAAVTAYSLTEKAFTEYKDKVVEQIGKNKEQKIQDEIVQEKVSNNPVGSREVIVVGGREVLCCELFTHRYFRSDMETLQKAQNKINSKILNELYVSLDEFYDLIGLSYTTNSHKMGWNSDKLLELKFSAVMADNDEPCLAFEYNYVKPLK